MNYQTWINNNWDFLYKWSRIWCPDNYNDLLGYFTLYLHDNWDKFNDIPECYIGDCFIIKKELWVWDEQKWNNIGVVNPTPDNVRVLGKLKDKKSLPDGNERKKFTQAWLKNNVRWEMSAFNKNNKVNNLGEQRPIDDGEVDDLIEIQCETDRDDIRDWLLDLTRNYNDTQVDRLVKLREIYLSLKTHEKVLWDLYWTNGLSLRAIGKKLNIPHLAVWTMINELKLKIKSKYGIDN